MAHTTNPNWPNFATKAELAQIILDAERGTANSINWYDILQQLNKTDASEWADPTFKLIDNTKGDA